MPAYEYLCDGCGNRFERRQKMSDPEVAACPECAGPVRRLISGGAGVISGHGAAAPRACEAGGSCCAPEMGCGGFCECGQ